ncbi:MAG: pyridoxal phosphate-dependent decarboxylase family protein [Burkholderiales bacterium]|jgi:sphinganine-1-phosphate aldolase
MKALPQTGWSRGEIDAALTSFSGQDSRWREGRVPLYVFGGEAQASEVGRDAFFRFFTENALGGKRAFPSLRQMEDDVVAIGLELFGAPGRGAGFMTTGGSESLFLGVRAAREHARRTRGLRKGEGNVVLPDTAHPGFTKATQCMDLDERRIPVLPDGRADVAAMAAAIDEKTVMIGGSAPCFPYGIFDPIEALGEVAMRTGVWLHVDACVGGWIAPHVRAIGRPVPAFDLSVPGVSSLSADLHKFGFCPKPASTLFFASPDRAAFAGFDLDWPSGRYSTSTMVGTRPGGAVAGAWATLHFLGQDGYQRLAQGLMKVRDAYVTGVAGLPGWRLVAEPTLTVMAFGDPGLDMMRVAQKLGERGWVPGTTSRPAGLHLMLSMLHEPSCADYFSDLAVIDREVRAEAQQGASGPRLTATY